MSIHMSQKYLTMPKALLILFVSNVAKPFNFMASFVNNL